MDFRTWGEGYNNLRTIIREVCDDENLTDIILFNEVVKYELLSEMKKVSDGGFKKKEINQFKRFLERFREKISGE